ncbi:MAG: hypothetical protein AAB458_01970 [Patescibacteria group bacterium]
MADDKKKPAPSGGGPVSDTTVLATIFAIIFGLLLLSSVLGGVERVAGDRFDEGFSFITYIQNLADRLGATEGWFATFKQMYVWIAWIVAALAGAGAMYAMRKHSHVMKAHNEQMKVLEEKIAGVGVSEKNDKWEHVITLSTSENPGDWRIAILEADIMLDELVTSMGNHGDTLGEKLKGIEQSDFATLEMAWEAHKIRNRIAHHGSDFILTHREAKRVIDLYRQVFEEFDIV